MQTVATRLSKASTLGKETDSVKSAGQSHSQSSGDERYVAFDSAEPNGINGDTNRVTDVFAYNRQTKQTCRVSVDSTGAQANGGTFAPEGTRDGRYVVVEFLASNLVVGDTNDVIDIFAHVRKTKYATRISVASGGA